MVDTTSNSRGFAAVKAQKSSDSNPSSSVSYSNCRGCKRFIRSAYVSALGGAWHPPCFVCHECKCPLAKGEGGEYGEQEGNPYCRRCFVKRLSPSCAKCGQPIVDGKGVQANGRVYHSEHFTCVLCKRPITGGFSEHQGQVYCEADFIRKFAQQCAGCMHTITEGKVTVAMGKKFHPECFKCHLCHCNLNGVHFAHKNGHLYCEKDYLNLHAPRCWAASCQKPITSGEVVTALGKTFHPEHFVCAHCGKVLRTQNGSSGGTTISNARSQMDGFVEKDGEAYCPEDWARLFCAKCKACNDPIVQGKVVRALGADWHAECFRCCTCNGILGPTDQFMLSDNGKHHCIKCYGKNFASICCVCGCAITGAGLQNFWGDVYCKSHDKEMPKCSSCGRLVLAGNRALKKHSLKPRLQIGLDYEDGRIACAHCDTTAVRDLQTAGEMISQVYGVLVGLGVNLPALGTLHVKLLDRPTIRSVAMQTGCASHTAAPWGVTVAKEVVNGPKMVGSRSMSIVRTVEYIGVLSALPKTHFCAVLAHELCHVHLLVNGYDRMSAKDEEGLCELAKYLYLQSLQTPESRFLTQVLENNSDPVYGGGFLLAKAAYNQTRSFPQVLAHVKKVKTLQSGRIGMKHSDQKNHGANSPSSMTKGRS